MARSYIVEYSNSKGRIKFMEVNADSKTEAKNMVADKLPNNKWKISQVDRKENNSRYMYVDERGFYDPEKQKEAVERSREVAERLNSLTRGTGSTSTSNT